MNSFRRVATKARRINVDFNAGTPPDPRSMAAMIAALKRLPGNADSHDHIFGWDAAEAVEKARSQVADLINARPNEIVFTSGATESVNLALKGFAFHRPFEPKSIVTSNAEHEAVLACCHQLERCPGVDIKYLPVDRLGRVSLSDLTDFLDKEKTVLVSLMFANNELGTIGCVEEAARIAHEAGALFFTDATQAVGKIPVDVRECALDLAAFSAHKVYGPKGVGALFVRSGEPEVQLEPLIVGGGQERGLRGGTLNVPGIVGFGEACRIAQARMVEETKRVRRLRDLLESELLSRLSGVSVNGDRTCRLSNTSNITFCGVDARTLIRDMHVLAASTRSACASARQGPSHVLKAIGLTDEESYSSIRFSLGRFTTKEEILLAIELVVSSVSKLRGKFKAIDFPRRVGERAG